LTFLWLLPRNLLIGFVLLWRKAISPLYGDVCRYWPSCSSYGLQSLQQHGVIKGVSLTTWRVLRCNPWSSGGVDEVKAGPESIVIGKLGFVSLNLQKKKR
jgi:putative membrane protein insertion efficiency factor